MIAAGSTPLRSVVVGDGTVEAAIGDLDGSIEVPLEVESVAVERASQWTDPPDDADCLVVDSRTLDADENAFIRECAAVCSDRPILFLGSMSNEAVLREVVASGIANVIPREVVTSEPRLLAEQIASLVRDSLDQWKHGVVYDHVPEPVSIHDPDTGDVLEANDAFEALTGTTASPSSPIGIQAVYADIIDHDPEHVIRAVGAAGEESPADVTWPVRTGDGETRWIESQFETTSLGTRRVVVGTSSRRNRPPSLASSPGRCNELDVVRTTPVSDPETRHLPLVSHRSTVHVPAWIGGGPTRIRPRPVRTCPPH